MHRNYKIMDEDIIKFINNSKMAKAYDLRFKESLFVRYMNENDGLTMEGFNILFNNYHDSHYMWCDNLVINDEIITASRPNFSLGMNTFKEYISNQNYEEFGIKHLDYKSAAHILISILSYYQLFNKDYNKNASFLYNKHLDDFYNYFKCENLFDEVYNYNDKDFSDLTTNLDAIKYDLKTVLEYYCLVGTVRYDSKGYYSIMSSDYAKKEIDEYINIYGVQPVQLVKKHVKSLI